MTSRVLLSGAALVLASAAHAPLAAQALAARPVAPRAADEPPRPKLAKGADPNDWRSYYVAGVKLLDRHPDMAIDAFWWAQRYSPASAEPLHARWVALWRSKPQMLDEYLHGAEYVMKAPETARIDSVLLQAVSIDPFVSQQITTWLYTNLQGEWSDDPETQGMLAYSDGHNDKAIALYGKAEKQATKDRDALRRIRYYRALAFDAAQQYDSAAAELEALAASVRAEEGRTMRPVYQTIALYDYGIGSAYLRAGKLDSARAALSRALAEDLSLYAAHLTMGEVAARQGKTEEALAEHRLALDMRPDDGAVHMAYGTALQKAEKLEEAVPEFERAVALEPYYAGTYFNLAAAEDNLGRKARAAVHYRDFLERAPRAMETQIAWAQSRIATLEREIAKP